MLPPFAQKILNIMEPDGKKQQEWIGNPELYPPSQSPAMQQFVSRIQKAIENQEKVFVAGDYDADGIMATAILVDGLKSLGLETGYYIPDRIDEGYGLSARTVSMVHDKGYSLIVTVDNGVRAQPALERAKTLGLDVIVSDHHLYEQEPECLVMVHPVLMEEPFSSLCGAAVAFEMLRALGMENPKHLRWAAIASIGDCMAVTGQTRRIIKRGLDSLSRQGDSHIAALAGKAIQNESDVSFQVVPKLNAIGRLSNMANVNTAVRFLLSSNPAVISDYAAKVEKLNDYRKDLTNKQSLLVNSSISLYKPVLISASSVYHEGIIGILAGQLTSAYKKPAIVASIRDGVCKASMRAPKGFNIPEFMKDFEGFSAFGGHSEAAGFSIPQENWEDFVQYCQGRMRNYTWSAISERRIDILPDEITLENIQALDRLRPFGPGFQCPDFVLHHPDIASTFDMGNGKHRKFTLKNGIQCLNFNQSPNDLKRSKDPIESMVGSLQVNDYRGRKSPNFVISELTYID